MACDFEVLLNAGQYPQGPEAALAALDLVDELEAQLTVYRDDSEVSQINRSADLREVEIEPRLFALFLWRRESTAKLAALTTLLRVRFQRLGAFTAVRAGFPPMPNWPPLGNTSVCSTSS